MAMGVIDYVMALEVYSFGDVRKGADALADQAKCRRHLLPLEHIEKRFRYSVPIGAIIESQNNLTRSSWPSLGLKNCRRA
jgi:hypothetical protein